ncbi:hypothetical protein B0O99DRAFT_686520 [Bisporella sp. PMI_857]|nr:hypothetical protein B0O99DRAFT_686520 [Bisporella sp. PMI_857]
MPSFSIRNATEEHNDAAFIDAAFDSTLPHLSSIGSGEQWGSVPFTQRGTHVEETIKQVRESESYRLTGRGEKIRVLIAEAEIPAHPAGKEDLRCRVDDQGRRWLRVGAAVCRVDWVPGYVLKQEGLSAGLRKEEREGGFVYLEVVVTDFRAGDLRKGAGGALIRGMAEFARSIGRRTVWADGWAGNGRKLIGYYESQGFEKIGDFGLERKGKNDWEGTLLRMDVGEEHETHS